MKSTSGLVVIGVLAVLVFAILTAGIRFFGPADRSFEATLTGEALAKFGSLPIEFRESLNYVAESPQYPQTPSTSYEKAFEFLRGLPADVEQVSEVLSPETLDMFNELSEENQSFLLLDVYSRVFGEEQDTNTKEPILPKREFEALTMAVHKLELGDGKVHLSPMEKQLSSEALHKLDEIAPIIRGAFLLIWRNLKIPHEERDDLATKLERALLDAPSEIPSPGELGLSQDALKTLEDVPNLKTFVEEYVAADLAGTGAWDAEGTEYSGAMFVERFIERASTPEGSRMFAQGLLPVTTYQPPPLISHFRPSEGFWPTWAIPPFFRDMRPENVVMEWPDHKQVLSQEALTKLNSLDSPLQEAFEKYWYGTGPLPNDAHWMAGVVVRWERDLGALPLDTLPEIEELLSGEDLAAYRRLDLNSRNVVTSQIAYDVLYGRTWLEDLQKPVYAYDTTVEEFLEALKTSVSRTVQEASKQAKRSDED